MSQTDNNKTVRHFFAPGEWIDNFTSSLIKKFKITKPVNDLGGDVTVVFHHSNKEYTYPNVPRDIFYGLLVTCMEGKSVGEYFSAHIHLKKYEKTS